MNIPNLISLLRNAVKANKAKIVIKSSKKIVSLLRVLVEYKYILAFSQNPNKTVTLYLDFTYKKSKILSFKHISKPSQSVYFSRKDLWKFDRTLGLIILNTPNGLISHKTALAKGIGGEALCYIL
jgi:small subunit ribosomal protein S8